MPILFVNPGHKKRRGVRVRGRAKVKLTARRKARRNPTLRYGQRKTPNLRTTVKMPRASATVKMTRRIKSRRRRASATLVDRKPKRRVVRRKRKLAVAKKKRRKSHRRGRATAARLGHRRRRRKAKASAPKRRRRRRAAPKRRRRAKRHVARKRRRRSHRRGRGRRTAAKLGHRRRRRRAKGRTRRATVIMGPGGTIKGFKTNPRRRRRARRGKARRRRSRRVHRRYSRGYRRNPGGMLVDLAKQALPLLLGFYGTRLLVGKLSTMIPGVSSLGTLAGPVTGVATLLGLNFAANKVAAIGKYKSSLLLGGMAALIDSLVSAFAPASVKTLIGVGDVYDRALGDYVGVGEYVGLNGMGAMPLNENIQMSDYVGVGLEEELGLSEELGLEEELGDDSDPSQGVYGQAGIGGIARGVMTKPVGSMAFVSPVPARSFTKQIPGMTGAYDSADAAYAGIFRGGF